MILCHAGLTILSLVFPSATLADDFSHRLVLVSEAYDKNLVAIRNESGEILWKQRTRGAGHHDVHLLDNGNVLLQDGWSRLVEMTLEKKIVWSYDASTMNGNQGKGVEIHAFLRLDDGLTMIAESGPARLIEVDRNGDIERTIPLTVDHPDVHRDTRLVRRRANGNYLVCHEGDGKVREYDSQGEVVWQHVVGSPVYGAIELKNGHVLIASGGGNSVLEVDRDGKTIWEIRGEVPGTDIELKWTTTLRERENGNFIIGNCHAGESNPQMLEITRDKKVVWQLRDFTHFGNGLAAAEVLTEKQSEQVRARLASIPLAVRVNDRVLQPKK